jgi:hypothetical protein
LGATKPIRVGGATLIGFVAPKLAIIEITSAGITHPKKRQGSRVI